ncbi:hypothetical protein CJF32_00000599 [Rutstroemia sp. NJR-2017a WRK4]|nr:hypothetical protein CJF32_00000599 [Rutstroemia sp. NJR-2017a WRK4]
MHTCHLNPYAARRILWLGDRALTPLEPLAYTYKEAADLINDNIANFRYGPSGNPPHDPFQRLKDNWVACSLSHLERIVEHPWVQQRPAQDLLLLYFEYFNTMIFGGGLNALRCTMELVEPSPEQKERRVLGTTIDTRERLEATRYNIAAHIQIYFRQQPKPETVEQKVQLLRDYLGTMLHEMVHAFFSIYVWREEALALELLIGNKEIWYADLDKLGLDEEDVQREMDWYGKLLEIADDEEQEEEMSDALL